VPDEWRIEQRSGDAATLHAAWPGVVARPERRAVAVCRVTGPAVVLGAAQPDAVLDAARVAAAGVPVVRRRSGGGAVLVTPDDPVWVDVWVPVGDLLWEVDVGRAFDWLGDTWVAALERWGIGGVTAHRGGYLACTRWSRLVCFGGIGTGEVVTGDGRKVVGLAQRRNRHGAWFHAASYLQWEPRRMVQLLALPDSERDAAADGLGAAVAGVSDLGRTSGAAAIGALQLGESVVAALP
jgi:lipoate---protein ligase